LINLLLQLWAGVLFQLPLQRADFLTQDFLGVAEVIEKLLILAGGDIGGHQLIHESGILTSATLGVTNRLRVVTKDLGVNHALNLPRAPLRESGLALVDKHVA
jgi:hypothetical protein